MLSRKRRYKMACMWGNFRLQPGLSVSQEGPESSRGTRGYFSRRRRGKMATFDKLIQEIGARYHLGPKGSSLVQETLDLIARQPGGIGGFLDRFKAAGFAAEVASWVGGTDVVPLSGQEVEETLGSGVLSEIAGKAEVSQRFAGTILGYAIPKIIGQLAQGGFPDLAIPLSSS